MNILWIQPSGILALTSIFDGSNPDEHAGMLKERGDIPNDWSAVGTNVTWPDTGWPHEAHRWDGNAVVVDYDAAVEITKARLRVERAPLLAANDLLLRDAMIDGDQEKQQAAVAERDRLRAITNIDPGLPLDELKSLSCARV